MRRLEPIPAYKQRREQRELMNRINCTQNTLMSQIQAAWKAGWEHPDIAEYLLGEPADTAGEPQIQPQRSGPRH